MSQITIDFKAGRYRCTECPSTFTFDNEFQAHRATHVRIEQVTVARNGQNHQQQHDEESDDESDSVSGIEGTISAQELEELEALEQSRREDGLLQRVDVNSPRFPFKSKMHQLFHEFYNQLDGDISQSVFKQVIGLCSKVMTIAREDSSATIPAEDLNINPHKRKSNQIPQLEVTEHDGKEKRKEENHYVITEEKFSMIKISATMKLLVANKDYTNELCALPDFTKGLSASSNGGKWQYMDIFQHPMTVYTGTNGIEVDYWVGFLVEGPDDRMYVLSKLYTLNHTEKMVEVHPVYFCSRSNIYKYQIKPHPDRISLASIKRVIFDNTSSLPKMFDCAAVVTLDKRREMLDTYLRLTTPNPLMRDDPSGNHKYMRVKVCPINLFTDDMSGNTTKKYNKVDNWSFVPATLSYKKRNQMENTFFICASNRLSATCMLTDIINDLVTLENDIEMACNVIDGLSITYEQE